MSSDPGSTSLSLREILRSTPIDAFKTLTLNTSEEVESDTDVTVMLATKPDGTFCPVLLALKVRSADCLESTVKEVVESENSKYSEASVASILIVYVSDEVPRLVTDRIRDSS